MGVCLGPFLPQIPSVSVIQKCRYHPQPLLSFRIASCGSHLTLCTKWIHDLHRNLLAETSALHHRFVPVVIRPNGSFVGLTQHTASHSRLGERGGKLQAMQSLVPVLSFVYHTLVVEPHITHVPSSVTWPCLECLFTRLFSSSVHHTKKRLNPVPKPTRLSRLAFPSPSVEAAALQSLAVDRVPLSAREGSTNIKQPTQLLHEASPFKVLSEGPPPLGLKKFAWQQHRQQHDVAPRNKNSAS
ncbi:uncharacterized protein CLUP02_05469 [Colletotrichum lupini]|uniref:Uncharacterized protein n=1 Tax=Colletotrichum lupini TaxID=145971 RepID=A0A9Q8WDR0_9PEZI|nr:uncharacterized protein CLUP02_05469 [Colletotrichum lupini]UQC79988.1 hypothetical protein CLUP02_05469 [Colletotrichum lupini]